MSKKRWRVIDVGDDVGLVINNRHCHQIVGMGKCAIDSAEVTRKAKERKARVLLGGLMGIALGLGNSYL